MANAELLYETLDRSIAAHAEGLLNMQVWLIETECGTAGCLAGWRVILDGGRPIPNTNREYYDGVGDYLATMPDGKVVDIEEYAQGRLELTGCECRALFAPNNTVEDLKEIVDTICRGGYVGLS